ncbi:MAG: cytochrome c3 family protein [Candidatus Thiodiazotropha sp.]
MANNFQERAGSFTVFLTALVLGVFSVTTTAGTIVGSDHDFSTQQWSGGEICVACHTPHNADTSVSNAPLWNHAVTTTSFTVYSSPTMDAGAAGQPDASSKLCLSCHDGTVAVDSFGGVIGGNFLNGDEAVGAGGDLSDDHPISITYNTALSSTDPGLHDPAATQVTLGQGGNRTKTGSIESVMLIGGQVQCSSCHDVHNTFTVPNTPLLTVSDAGSQLCLTCHNK